MGDAGRGLALPWNFGPEESCGVTVAEIAAMVAVAWGPDAEIVHDPGASPIHETATLRLDSGRARTNLGWFPRWSLVEAVDRTVEWHRALSAGADLREICLSQIDSYAGPV